MACPNLTRLTVIMYVKRKLVFKLPLGYQEVVVRNKLGSLNKLQYILFTWRNRHCHIINSALWC